MKSLWSNVLFMLIMLVVFELLFSIGEEEKSYLKHPWRFVISTVVISLISGYLLYRVNQSVYRAQEEEDH
jgi:hypothetical protein